MTSGVLLETKEVKVAEMTAEQLKMLIRETVRETLQDLFEDPDLGLELRPEFAERLRQSVAYVASGGDLLSLEELTQSLAGE